MTDEELIARLRGGVPTVWEKQAADRIEALVKDVAYWQADSAAAWDKCEERRARAERLEAALRGLMMHEPDHPDTLWQDARAALKGGDHE